MKAKLTKQPTGKRLAPGVTTLTFEPGCHFEFTDLGLELPSQLEENNKKKLSNGKTNGVKKTSAVAHDRRRLKHIEILLNNCLNLATAIETKQAAKIVQLLRDTREQVIRLRG